jgi:catechol 2,3-dioxygenase-like lactoylglutathione lyase family enzyme
VTNHFNKAHHIGVVVQDIEASEAWYAEHLGFEHLYYLWLAGSKGSLYWTRRLEN